MADESVFGFDLPENDPNQPVEVKTSQFQAVKAAAKLSFLDSPTKSLERLNSLNKIRQESEALPKLTPAELNAKFPEMPQPFESPMNERVAQEIYNRQRERQGLQKIIEAGPQGKLSSALKFGAMLIPQAVDPVGLAAGMGVGKIFQMALTGGKFAFAAKAAQSTFGKAILAAEPTASQILIKGGTEGLIGNALAEVAPVAAAQDDLTDYSWEQATVNVVGGTLGFTAGVAALKKGFDVTGNFVNRGGGKARSQVVDMELAQVHQGNKVNAETLAAREMVRETNVPNPDYQFVDARKQMPEVIHVPKKVSGGDLDSENGFFSDGLYNDPTKPMIEATDDALIANNSAARKMEAGSGDVITVAIPKDAKIAHLDDALDGEAKAVFSSFLESQGIKEDITGLTGNDVIRSLQELVNDGRLGDNVLQGLHDMMREAGFDMYHKVIDQVGGEPHRPHNGFYVLNKERLSEVERMQAKSELVPNISKAEKQELFDSQQSQTAKRTFSEDGKKEFDTASLNPSKELDVKSLESEFATLKQELMEVNSPEAKAQLDEIANTEARFKLSDLAFKAVGLCLGKI